MRRSSALLFLALGTTSLFGFGCRERPLTDFQVPGQAASAKIDTPPPVRTPYVSKKKTEDTAAKEVVELRQFLTNLSKVQSYHSRILAPVSAGIATADVYYSKVHGMHGILHTDSGNSEIYVRDRAVFVRYASNTWEDVSFSDEAASVRNKIKQSLFVNEDGSSQFLIRDSAKVISVNDDPSGCKLYSLEQKFYAPEENTQKLEICIKNTFPVRLKSSSADGSIEIMYDQLDDTSILAKPPNT